MTISYAQTNAARTLLAAALAAVSGGGAIAADLGGAPRAPAPEPYGYVSPLDTARWSGAYLGISYGYADGITTVTRGPGAGFDLDQTGGIGSVYGGYNWQLGNIVLGLEADLGIASYQDAAGNGAARVSSELNNLLAARARAGVLLTPAFLIYGTGGFAWGDMDFKANGVTQTDWLGGYQIGAGTELNVAGPWTLRLEYLYTDLDSQTFNHGGVKNTYDPDFHTVRAGVSFKF